MRELKFRAFHGKTMYYSDKDYLANLSWYFEATEMGLEENHMQYTGLKDKNGIEIYEGDIIKARVLGIVEFNLESLAWLVRDKTTNIVYQLSRLIGIEIIGNIYENPELLEK